MIRKRQMYAGIVVAAVFVVLMVLSGLDGARASELTPAASRKVPATSVGDSPAWWNPLAGITAAWHAFDRKLDAAAHVDQQNELLRQRVAELELTNARLSRELDRYHEQERADELKAEARAEGGLDTARTIASLQVADPALLQQPAKARFAAAAAAFAKGDYETSGRALASLVDDAHDTTYQTAQSFYLAGVSLYKVGDYKKALSYLARAEDAAIGTEISYAPRAAAWKALCFRALGQPKAEAAAIKQLIQKYPRSQEARRLNRNA